MLVKQRLRTTLSAYRHSSHGTSRHPSAVSPRSKVRHSVSWDGLNFQQGDLHCSGAVPNSSLKPRAQKTSPFQRPFRYECSPAPNLKPKALEAPLPLNSNTPYPCAAQSTLHPKSMGSLGPSESLRPASPTKNIATLTLTESLRPTRRTTSG